MEPFPKRQRLYSPIGPSFPQSFNDEEAYYDDDDLDDFVVDEEEEDEEEQVLPDLDPESDFQQKRARLDYKLKSTFEAIFEKYGRDFDGVGDEIDIATGEIVVNNGHLLQMLDERDAGDTRRANSVPTEITEESQDLPSSALEISDSDGIEDEDDEEDDDSEEGSEDDMVEDDLILRGFAQANRFRRPSPELGSLKKPAIPARRHRDVPLPPSNIPKQVPKQPPKQSLPSQSEILAQFGPQLGPQIVQYVSKQVQSDTSVLEPAWRAPELPAFKSRKSEGKKPMILAPSPERSPSPEEATSIWALPRKRGRKRRTSAAILGGESSTASKLQNGYHVNPLDSSLDLEEPDQASGKRRKFTEEDDQILLDWVTRVRHGGLTLSDRLWRELAANHPIHSWTSWRYRYKHHFTYLLSNSTEDSEVSASEPSVDSLYVGPPGPRTVAHHSDPISNDLAPDMTHLRPTRIRKPAQRDSRIISWTEAVDALETLDPDLHAGMLEDSRNMKIGHPQFAHASIASVRKDVRLGNTSSPAQQTATQVPKAPPREVVDLTDDLSDVEAAPVREQYLIPGAPCPHADCRLYPTTLYRLQRRDNEELSEMCLHLFRVHHTTPFPCGEIGCPRTREEGYFMQADLVRHVRTAHPSVGALHRLRGRVDSALLDRNIELATPPSDPAELPNRPVSQQRDSDFMSPRKATGARGPSFSIQPSSTSDPDRTPQAPTTIRQTSHSTLMTSVSSMKVHHPSTTKPSIEDQDEVENMNVLDDLSMRAHRSTIDSSGGLGSQHVRPSSSFGVPTSRSGQEPDSDIRTSLPTPVTTHAGSLGPAFSFLDETARRPRTAAGNEQQFAKPPAVQRPAHMIKETPDPISSQVQAPSQSVPSTYFGPPTKGTMGQTHSARPIQRNTLDPGYQFSDEEVEPTPVFKGPQLKTLSSVDVRKLDVATSFAGPSSSSVSSLRPGKNSIGTLSKKDKPVVESASNRAFATPAPQKPIRKSTLRVALDADDLDELSLDKDDVILLSSRPNNNPLSAIQQFVKQEEVMNTPRRILASSALRKRTFSSFQDRSSPDELANEEPSPSSKAVAGVESQIKAEEDESLPEHPTTLPNHRTENVRKDSHPNAIPSVMMTPSISGRQLALRTSTPLLNLTPTSHALASQEIRDSAAEESSPVSPTLNPPQRARARRQKEADSSTSPMSNILTPTRKKPAAEDFLKAEQVTVIVKTPGGTFRRCGENGFTCGRSFCFRCGSQGTYISH